MAYINGKDVFGFLIGADHSEAYDAGKQAEYDRFWDNLQQNGNRTNYTYAFYQKAWTDEIYNPKYPINIEQGNGVYNLSAITDTKVPIDITNCSSNGQVFQYAQKMKTIRKLIIGENSVVPSALFGGCSALENITIEGVIVKSINFQWSTKLSRSSIESIIFHLSLSVGKTLTLSKTAVDKAFETSEGANNGSLTGDWTYLEDYCADWEILLV